MRETWRRIAAIVMGCMLFTGCGVTAEVDDYATNQGSYAKQSDSGEAQTDSQTEESTAATGIPKDQIKVGVLHLSDPADGSGYTYTHDLGIQGMQQNLGLSNEQIIRMWMIQMKQLPNRQFRNVLMKAATSSLQQAGVTCRRQRIWQSSTRMSISPTEPAI